MTADAPALTVLQSRDGSWRVQRGRKVVAKGLSQGDAWREWDRHNREAEQQEEARRRASVTGGQG
jgi:hypothetical protein